MFSMSTVIQRRGRPLAAAPPAAPPIAAPPPAAAKPATPPTEPARRAPLPSNTWTRERVEQLRRGFETGLSCSQIADTIGVTRNAVIGKLHRMGLSRPKDVIRDQLARARQPRRAGPKSSTKVSIKRLLDSIRAQQAMPATAFSEPVPSIDIVPVDEGRGRSLSELAPSHCRWPFGTPGADDFRYCGHEVLNGFSYCFGHAAIAHRTTGRPRSFART